MKPSDNPHSTKVMLEVFSGSGNMARAFREAGYKTLTVDLHKDADLQIDVREITYDMVVEHLGKEPDVIWLSPPCTGFSRAAIGTHWKDYRPDKVAQEGIALFAECFRLIMLFRNSRFYIENPEGMTGTLPILDRLPRYGITFCQYGEKRQKPTSIWTNDAMFVPRRCRRGQSCHDLAPRGSKTGTQGLKNSYDRGSLPIQFCRELAGLHRISRQRVLA